MSKLIRIDQEDIMGPVEIVAEFRKGCTNTMDGDLGQCQECLDAAMRALFRCDFTVQEARNLLLGPDT